MHHSPTTPSISIIVSAYNEEKYIENCLKHILADTYYVDEIIVIDNASTDQTNSIVQKFDRIKVFVEHRQGVSFARQRGYEESTGDIIAFLDADTCMPRGWIQKVINAFQDKDVGFVSGPYSYYDVSHIAQIGSFFGWRTLGYIGYLMVGYLGVGGNFAIRRTVLDQMNGFDTSIVFYGDDTDAARRASQYSKSLFLLHLTMPTSARRFVGQGLFKTLYVYILNYWSQAIRHRSATTTCQHFR